MSWLWWIGGGTAALVLVLGLGYLLGLGGVVTVVKAVLGAMGDAAATFRRWLRIPGNKTRAFCGALALTCLVAGLQSWQRGTVIIQQRADYLALKDRTDLERAGFVRQLAEKQAVIDGFSRIAEQQRHNLDLLAIQNRQVLDEAERARSDAREQAAAFKDAYANRPADCTQALQALELACPTLRDY